MDSSVRSISIATNDIFALTLCACILGSGKFENSVSPTVIRTFSSDDAALRVACGSESTMAVCKDSLYVWGWNEHGNLGMLPPMLYV